ncbi:MAG: sn-glycerol-1-phosphate dehydrogenase [Archaeoglobaceae archaeon]
MRFHTVSLPFTVIISEGARRKIPEVLDVSSVALLTDEIVYEIVAAEIEKNLECDVTRFFVERASMDEAKKIILQLVYGDVEAIIGVGGGKVLDVAKVVSTELNVPFVSVPTTASHDGIASPVASFKENGKPVSITTNPPLAVFADIEVIKRCPIRLIRSGYGDLISNVSAVKDWQIAAEKVGESYNEVAASIALMPAELMLSKVEGLNLRLVPHLTMLVRGLVMSGVAIAIVGSSRPVSGAEHKFSHALDYLGYGRGLHGEQVALGTIIMEYFHEKAYGVGDWEMIRNSLEKVRAPTTAREIGLTREQVIEALMYAKRIRRKRYTILEDLNPSKEDFEIAIEKTGVA